MNKKIIALIVSVVVLVALVLGIYFIRTNNDNKNEGNNSNNTQLINFKELKVAVVYFSATGNTKSVAEYVSNATGGDLIPLIPEVEYLDKDLTYDENSRANVEQKDDNARPGIKNEIPVENYDVLFIGYPIWFGQAPKIMFTFIDKYDLSGKIVIPFCTSASSDISASMSKFKEYNKNIKWIKGKRLTVDQEKVNAWVNSISY